VLIHHILCVGCGGWDFDVWFEWYDEDGVLHKNGKNVYFFQVHYFHPQLEQEQPTLDQVQRQSIWRKP
jgi:hypothetical protein